MSYRMKKKPASMRVKKEVEQKTESTCSDCARPEWNEENRNHKGEIFIGYCPFGRFGTCKSKGLNVTYTDAFACENIIKKGGRNDVRNLSIVSYMR